MEKEVRKKKVLLPIIALFSLLLIVIGVSYAIFTFVGRGVKENTITSGAVTIIYTEGQELNIQNAMPIDDETGKTLTGAGNVFEFTVQTNLSGNTVISYEIAAIKKNTSTLKDDEIKLYLEKNNTEILNPTHFVPIQEQTEIGSPSGSMIIDSGTFTTKTTNHYIMKMWVDENTEITEKIKTYTITVDVYAKDILVGNGVAPEECFVFDANTQTITDYKCGINNTSDMKYYEEVTIPSQIDGVEVTTIGNLAFSEKGIKKVIIADTITTIQDSAFSNNNITQLEIPDTVQTIGINIVRNNQLKEDKAFIYKRENGIEDNTILTSYGGANRSNVVIPSNVKEIGDYCFANIELTSITIPEGVEKIGDFAFRINKLTSFNLPSTVKEIGVSIVADNLLSNNDAFVYKRNVDGTIDNTVINSYGGSNRDNIVIPANVKKIESYAFYNQGIKNITIPTSLEEIGIRAFQKNNIENLTIPATLKILGTLSFAENKISNLTLPNIYIDIQGGAFNHNDLNTEDAFIYQRNEDGTINNEVLVSYGGSERDNITIKENITSIYYYAFAEVGLSNIIIPNSITKIMASAFQGNPLLTRVIVPSSISLSPTAFDQNVEIIRE